jgi:hypothetical protein
MHYYTGMSVTKNAAQSDDTTIHIIEHVKRYLLFFLKRMESSCQLAL